MSAARVGLLIWVLIYGGLLACGLGIALSRGGHGYGWGIVVAGAAMAVVGALLVWLRSRMSDAGPG